MHNPHGPGDASETAAPYNACVYALVYLKDAHYAAVTQNLLCIIQYYILCINKRAPTWFGPPAIHYDLLYTMNIYIMSFSTVRAAAAYMNQRSSK